MDRSAKVVVASQRLFDRRRRPVGAELLWRSPTGEPPDGTVDGDVMTAEVIYAVVHLGLHRGPGSLPVYLNANRRLLTGELPVVLPPRDTVLEVSEQLRYDTQIVAGARRLVDAGYRLALDDFEWQPGCEALLDLASIVKLDIEQLAGDHLDHHVQMCRRWDVTLVAERIETKDDYRRCIDLGFDYFQGFLLHRPATFFGQVPPPCSAPPAQCHGQTTDVTWRSLQRLLEAESTLFAA